MDCIKKLKESQKLSPDEYQELIRICDNHELERQTLMKLAKETAIANYGNKVYIRGLIEISNYCKNDCYYCGIRRGNRLAERYRLSIDEILSCCDKGYPLGFRTFVLQGGEDPGRSEDEMCRIIYSIKSRYPDCAVTLSLGEKPYLTYKQYFDAGADRYLLRQETANNDHYRILHPGSMSLDVRKECLWNLKEIGFQVGTGIMVGSPGQNNSHLAEDLAFIQELQPQMVGIGPFLPHSHTPFFNQTGGSVEKTITLLSILRLMLPKALLPASTALGTACRDGREQGILAGANVVMPNLSPGYTREKYTLYDNKLNTGAESAEHIKELKDRLNKIGYEIEISRGDALG